jgi:hypothetical protein
VARRPIPASRHRAIATAQAKPSAANRQRIEMMIFNAIMHVSPRQRTSFAGKVPDGGKA